MFENYHNELSHCIGGDRLAYINVYYDFDWQQVFNHNRSTFPNGKCLAKRVKSECPKGKVPELILTKRDDAKVTPIETETCYAVVVKIKDYLDNPSFDPSANYFATACHIPLTKSSIAKDFMDNPELVTQIIESGLSIEMVGRWARGATGRGLQLKQLVESMDTVSEDGENKTHISANLDSAVALLKWFAETGYVEPVLSKIMELGITELNNISSVLGAINLRRIMELWDREKKNSSEEYWQDQLKANPWLISQVFSDPVVIFADKAYVGGKVIDNTGGNIVDFLYKNQMTAHVKLVEIKTPTTKLLSSPYRNVFSISAELTGSINQVLNYREEIEKNFYALSSAPTCKYEVINPRCLLIAGSFENEQLNDTQKKSFEIFRSELKNVEIITFDELFAKIQLLLGLLEQ